MTSSLHCFRLMIFLGVSDVYLAGFDAMQGVPPVRSAASTVHESLLLGSDLTWSYFRKVDRS